MELNSSELTTMAVGMLIPTNFLLRDFGLTGNTNVTVTAISVLDGCEMRRSQVV